MDGPRQATILPRNDHDANKLTAALRNEAGHDETKGDATGVSMTGGAPVVAGTKAGGTAGATGAAAGKAPSNTSLGKDTGSGVDTESDYENWSLCGVQDYDEDFTEADPPVRIKESLLSPEDRKHFKAILDRIFANECAQMGAKIPFEYQDVFDVMAEVLKLFQMEPTLIEDLPNDIVVVADIHGQLFDLDRIFSIFARDGKPGWECRKFLFLGDYVDRGRQSLEVIMGLFIIKMLFPDNIFLLRGNHEFVMVSLGYGFAREINERWDRNSAFDMYDCITGVFSFMSLAAIIGGNRYFCAHGGISPQGFTRRNLQRLLKPIYRSDADVLVHDLVWADPAEGLRGTCMNVKRHWSHFFGADAVVEAMDAVGCHMMIRGHSILQNGFENHMNLVISIFSATGCTNKNDAAVADIDADGRIMMHRFPYCEKRHEYEKECLAIDGRTAEEDAKTVCSDDGTGALAKM